MHVIQPFTDFSYVKEDGPNPTAILGFDRFSTFDPARGALDFPQFTSIDSIADWTVWRVGRSQPSGKHAAMTGQSPGSNSIASLMCNSRNPYQPTDYSNLVNNIRFTPLPWMSLSINSQVPAFAKGFTEVDTVANVQPFANLQLTVAHRYLNGNPFFPGQQFVCRGRLLPYRRQLGHWSPGAIRRGQPASSNSSATRSIETCRAGVASFGGIIIRDNNGSKEYGRPSLP